jgi:hypothetical protein
VTFCNSPARVVVDGTDVPYINEGVHVEMRKGGPTDLTRVADVRVPASWYGESYTDTIGLAEGAPSGYRRARIEIRDGGGGYTPVIDGFLLAVGGGDGSQNELRIRIGDPAKFLPSIQLTASFGVSDVARLSDVLAAVESRFNEAQPVYDGVTVVADTGDVAVAAPAAFTPAEVVADAAPVSDVDIPNPKRFTRNRDDLVDVLDWVAERIGAVYYFEPTDPPTLRLTTNPSQSYADERAGGSVTVRQNDALSEIRPINTLELTGAAGRRVELGSIETTLPDFGNEYPVAVVRATELYERAGDTEVRRADETRQTELDATVEEAKRRLKKLTDTKSGGSMDLAPTPGITPYDRLDVLPGCDDRLPADYDPVTYEVERLRHRVAAPTEQYPNPHTEVECSLFTSLDDVEIVTREMRKL